MVNGRN